MEYAARAHRVYVDESLHLQHQTHAMPAMKTTSRNVRDLFGSCRDLIYGPSLCFTDVWNMHGIAGY